MLFQTAISHLYILIQNKWNYEQDLPYKFVVIIAKNLLVTLILRRIQFTHNFDELLILLQVEHKEDELYAVGHPNG